MMNGGGGGGGGVGGGRSGQLNPWQQQDEQDRRWQNMSYEMDQMKQQGRYPRTGGEFQDIIIRHGLYPQRPLPGAMAEKTMEFDEFMNLCGNRGWTLMVDYEAKTLPDAPRKCDGCSLRGARMRCSNCGETYCSTTCQKKEWKDHRQICCMAGKGEARKLPPLMTWDEYDAKVLLKKKKEPTKTARKPPSTATAPAPVDDPVMAPNLGSEGPSYSEMAKRDADSAEKGPGKNAKKNAKKREKAKAAKAQSGSVAEGEVSVPEVLPAYANVD